MSLEKSGPRSAGEPQPRANTGTGTARSERSQTPAKSGAQISCAFPPGTDMPLVLVIVGQPQITHIGDLRANLHDLAAIGHFTRPRRLRTNGHFDLVIDEISPLQVCVLLIVRAHLTRPDVSEAGIIDLDREELPFLALALALLHHAFHRAQALDDTA